MLMNIWGTLASLSIIVSYLPQLRQTFTTKNVEGQNIYFWGLLTFSVAYFFVNAIVGSAGIVTILAQLFNLLGAGSMLIMVYKYQHIDNQDLEFIEDNGYFYKTKCNKCGEIEKFASTISKPKHRCKETGVEENESV